MEKAGKIGVFDSGYGGLTILKEITKQMPDYDFLYLGDNARSPYGTRSFETVYQYTWECVQWLFKQGCHLVILACNTASAKALRSIQQKNLPSESSTKKVLGVLRPTTEVLGNFSKTKSVGILATTGTVLSNSYLIEVEHFFPELKVYQQACPMWVPLIENNEHFNKGADYFVEKYINALLVQDKNIDAILLACTHYPLLLDKIKKHLPSSIEIITQGTIVANSLQDYLKRHEEQNVLCSKNGIVAFFTTDSTEDFDKQATTFWGNNILSKKAVL